MRDAHTLTPEERRVLWTRMRVPAFSGVALLLMLCGIVALGLLLPGGPTSWAIAGITAAMAATVLLFSMEVRLEPPLMRFFAGLGFAWVGILFGMILLDYLSRTS